MSDGHRFLEALEFHWLIHGLHSVHPDPESTNRGGQNNVHVTWNFTFTGYRYSTVKLHFMRLFRTSRLGDIESVSQSSSRKNSVLKCSLS